MAVHCRHVSGRIVTQTASAEDKASGLRDMGAWFVHDAALEAALEWDRHGEAAVPAPGPGGVQGEGEGAAPTGAWDAFLDSILAVRSNATHPIRA